MLIDSQQANELRKLIAAEQEVLSQKVFTIPPKTWEEFQQRVGRYKALASLDGKVEDAMKKREELDEHGIE